MRLTFKPHAIAAALLLSCVGPVQAADTVFTYPEMLVDDIVHVFTAPARWQEHQWQDFGRAAVSVIGVAALVDRPFQDEMRRHTPNNNRFLLEVERFGAEYSLAVLSGFYLSGSIGNNETASAVAQDGLAACLIASGIVTPSIKLIAGRSRPRENVGIATFHPFSMGHSSNSSFPSGHTTQAFALASVISSHYDDRWVKYSSYTVAGLVGLARSYHDAHFASDVLAGALIGSLVGQSVVENNQAMRDRKVVLLPVFSHELLGVRLTNSF